MGSRVQGLSICGSQTLERVGDGQGSLLCCSPWGRKESDTTEQLNRTDAENKTLNQVSILEII